MTPEQQRVRARARARLRQAEFDQQAAQMDPADLRIAQTKNDPFGEYLRAKAMEPREGESDAERERRLYGSLGEAPGTVEGIARSALQGATFGAGDEAVAAATAGLDMLAGRAPFSEAYDMRLGNERRDIRQFREDSPVAAYGSEIAGAIPTAGLSFLNAPRGASLLGRILSGAGTGAGQGALYGFNAGEGGIQDRALNAAVTSGIGGAVGAAAPAVGAAGRTIYDRTVGAGRAARQAGMSRPAYDVLSRTMAADDSLTGQGAANIRAGGPSAMLADAGPSARSLLDTAAQRSGPAASIARGAVDDRATQAARSVTQTLDDTLGVPGQSSSRALIVYGDKTNPLELIYRRAYEKPIDYSSPVGQKIEDLILRRVPPRAIRAANELMRVEGEKSRQIIARLGDDGSILYETMPDVRQIDYITRGLNEVASQADGKGVMGGTTQTGRAYANLSRELRGALKEAVPEYRQALDTAAGMIREGKAKEFGGVLLSPRTTRADVADMVSDMGEAEKRKVAEGLRQYIDDTLATTKRMLTDPNVEAREAVRALKDLSSRASREKVAAVIGPQRAAGMFDELDQATRAFELRAAIRENSRTFARTELDDAIQGVVSEGPVNALRRGEPLNAAQRLARALLGRTDDDVRRMGDDVYTDLVNALTGPRGQQAIDLLEQITKARQTVIPKGEEIRLLGETLMGRNAAVTAPLMQR